MDVAEATKPHPSHSAGFGLRLYLKAQAEGLFYKASQEPGDGTRGGFVDRVAAYVNC